MRKNNRGKDRAALSRLSRREQEIMDIIFRQQKVSCSEVQAELSEPPSYSAVRAMLNKLVEKGFLATQPDGKRYLYYPVVSVDEASERAVQRLVRTFFGGSISGAIVALVNSESDDLDARQLRELESLLREKRKQQETQSKQ